MFFFESKSLKGTLGNLLSFSFHFIHFILNYLYRVKNIQFIREKNCFTMCPVKTGKKNKKKKLITAVNLPWQFFDIVISFKMAAFNDLEVVTSSNF